MRPLLRSCARLSAAWPLLLAGCASEATVHADNPDVLPVDVRAIDHALVVNASVREGYGYELAPSAAFNEFLEWDSDFPMDEGVLGTATVLLSAGPIACDEVRGDAPPAGSTGIFLVYRWWTTTEADPGWEGDYGVGGVIDDEGTGRLAVVGSWTESGALDWPFASGTATLDAWDAGVEGVAELDPVDAGFTADRCGEEEGAR